MHVRHCCVTGRFVPAPRVLVFGSNACEWRRDGGEVGVEVAEVRVWSGRVRRAVVRGLLASLPDTFYIEINVPVAVHTVPVAVHCTSLAHTV